MEKNKTKKCLLHGPKCHNGGHIFYLFCFTCGFDRWRKDRENDSLVGDNKAIAEFS